MEFKVEIAECFKFIVEEHKVQDSDILISNEEKLSFKKSSVVFTVIHVQGTKTPYFIQWTDVDGETYTINGGMKSQESVIEVIYMILDQ